MTDLILLFDSIWRLLWFPLQNLSFDNPIIVSPLILLIIGYVFGSVFKVLRGRF